MTSSSSSAVPCPLLSSSSQLLVRRGRLILLSRNLSLSSAFFGDSLGKQRRGKPSNRFATFQTSVADPRCFYPGSLFYPFRIPTSIHTGSRIQQQQQKRRGEKFVVLPFFCSLKFYKIENLELFYFLASKEKYFSQFTSNFSIFYQINRN
jgi:hypothetical protein